MQVQAFSSDADESSPGCEPEAASVECRRLPIHFSLPLENPRDADFIAVDQFSSVRGIDH
jgi:hypothetical protein